MKMPINIKNLLNDKIVEDVRIEYKEGFNPATILPTICAFANDIDNFAGGYIVIGIKEENGIPVFPVKGLNPKEVDKIEKELIEYCKKCLSPQYLPVIDHCIYEKKDLLVLWCYAGDDRPYKCYKNVYLEKKNTKYVSYIRKGSTTIVATDYDEKELYSLSRKSPFDDRCNYNATIDDIDKDLIIDYLKEIKSDLYKHSNSMSKEELLENLLVLAGPKENYHPRNIALLMFSNKPEKYIPYSYIDFSIITNPNGNGMVEKLFKGSIVNQYKDVMNYIKNNVIEKKTFKQKNTYKSKTIYNYPYEALEEIIANAILHKSYQENEPVTIRVESDHIEITSIPGFDRTISDIQITNLKPRSKRYLNRRIAEFLKELNIVEAKNTGYPEIVERCKENGSPMPIIDMNENRDYVTVSLPINELFKTGTRKKLEELIIDALSIKPMKKTELCRYLGYDRIVNSVDTRLKSMIDEDKLALNNNKEYELK